MAELYLNYNKTVGEIDNYISKYPFLSVVGIGDSTEGQVYALMFGEGETVITYVGGEDGGDMISPSVLLRFVRDICSLYEEKGSAFGFSAENIFKNYTLVIIPMLSSDYTGEAQTGNVCNFFKYGMTPNILLTFRKSNENNGMIYFGEGETENKMAVALSQMSALKRNFRVSEEPRITLADWSIENLRASAFSIDLPNFNYNNGKQFSDKSFSLYAKMRKTLFCTPFLSKIK